MIEHAVDYDVQTDQMTLFSSVIADTSSSFRPEASAETRRGPIALHLWSAPAALPARPKLPTSQKQPALPALPRASKRQHHSPMPRGLARLVELGLVVAGSPAASALEGVLNRLESERSLDTYTSDLAAYLRFVRDRGADLFAAPRDLVSSFVAYERGAGLAAYTRRRRLQTVRLFYEEAIDREAYSGRNPTKGVARIRGEARNEPVALTTEEAAELLTVVDKRIKSEDRGVALRAQRDGLALRLFLLCGFRAAELAALRWGDRGNDGDYRVFTIVGKGGKRAKMKINPVLDAMIDEFQRQLAKAGIAVVDTDPVFFGIRALNGSWPPLARWQDGWAPGELPEDLLDEPPKRPMPETSRGSGKRQSPALVPLARRQMNRMVGEALDEIGRDGPRTGPHLLRRTSGTLLYEQTRDLYLVQQHLRHSSPDTTAKHYIRQSDPLRNAGIDHLDFG